MNWIFEPWPWYVAGPMIAFIMFLLLMVGKSFGMSANLRTICAICGAGNKANFFNFDWKSQKWNLVVIIGAVIGGYIGSYYLTTDMAVAINADTITDLNALGFESAGKSYLPDELFETSSLFNVKGGFKAIKEANISVSNYVCPSTL